jgi:UDP-N-acetylmuramoyl-L-alanyl-D-glutamate--2,6-diaminopimelate ligase
MGMAVDSRQVCPGDLFCALSGTARHGGDFIAQAVARGAVAVLIDEHRAEAVAGLAVPIVKVRGLAAQVGRIAARYYGEPSNALRVIGVTGTNGKTSVSHFVAQALNRSFAGPAGVIGTIGNGLLNDLRTTDMTTPDAITLQRLLADLRERHAQSVVMEVSSHGLSQQRVSGVGFEVAVFTNLTRDHLDYHGDMAAYASAKALLFQRPELQAAVLNLDDPFGSELLAHLAPGVKAIGYGLQPVPAAARLRIAAMFRGTECAVLRDGLRLTIEAGATSQVLRSRILGRFNAYNLLAAVATLVALGIPLDDTLRQLQDVTGVPGRLERFGGDGDRPLVVVDYAHTPDGLEQALTSLREVCAGKLWCVFGCGGDRDRGKRPQMGAIAERLADAVVLTWDNPRSEAPERIIDDILSGIADRTRITVMTERRVAIAYAIAQAQPDDVVLIAGKGHESYQEIQGQRIPYSDRVTVAELIGVSAT